MSKRGARRVILSAREEPVAPDTTRAESYYYAKQVDSGTPLVVVLQGGERVTGSLRWYDADSLGLRAAPGRDVAIDKAEILYLFKLEEESRGGQPPAPRPR